MKIDEPYLLIDIDDEKIIFFVVKFDNQLNSEIVNSKVIESQGILNGRITDVEKSCKIIKKNLTLIENEINYIFKDATIIINPDNTECLNISGYKKLNGSQVLEEDVAYILNDIKKIVTDNKQKYSLIHLFNSNFSIDKNNLNNLPLGLYGDFYNQDMTFFIVEKNNLKNFKSTLNNSEINIERIILKPFAEGIKLLSKNSSEKKITTIKLGKKRSNISLFKNHSFIYSENFDFGSDLIIKDVAKLCSIDFDNSSRILTDIVFSKVESNKEIEYLDKKYFKEIPFRKITLELLIDIFNSRLDEIFEIIYDKNINLVNLKSNNVINIIVEDQELSVNINHSLDKNFSGKSKILFHKLDKDYLLSACLGATELIGKGWSKEAIPIIQSKKSTISRILSNIFN